MTCAALAIALCTGLTSCSRPAAPSSSQDHKPRWTATFEQDRPDQASRNAHVKLTNTRHDEVAVDGVRLRWSGYPDDRWQAAEMTYAPGNIHRLDIRLPRPPHCDGSASDRPNVEVRLTTGTTDTVPLDAPGTAWLRRLWKQDCREHRLQQAVHVGIEGWRLIRRRSDPVLRGDLVARRGSTSAEVSLVETRGSVLLDFEPQGRDRVLLSRTAEYGRIPIAITSNGRCDPHSVGQSTQTFTLRAWVSLDGGPEQPLVIMPGARTRKRMQSVIAIGCGLR